MSFIPNGTCIGYSNSKSVLGPYNVFLNENYALKSGVRSRVAHKDKELLTIEVTHGSNVLYVVEVKLHTAVSEDPYMFFLNILKTVDSRRKRYLYLDNFQISKYGEINSKRADIARLLFDGRCQEGDQLDLAVANLLKESESCIPNFSFSDILFDKREVKYMTEVFKGDGNSVRSLRNQAFDVLRSISPESPHYCQIHTVCTLLNDLVNKIDDGGNSWK